MRVTSDVMDRARGMVANARRKGTIQRKPCEVCGTTLKVHAHHDDYSKPLEVKWLCAIHHRARHKELGAPLVQTCVVRVNLEEDLHRTLRMMAIEQGTTLRQLVIDTLTELTRATSAKGGK